MAQTRRRRQTKHRGNAAGKIETRGRTGRPLSSSEKGRGDRNQQRQERLNRKPTWKGSAQRAVLAGGFIFVFLLFVDKPKHGSAVTQALIFAVISMLFYMLIGFYFETFLWRRRMAKQRAASTR
jgi:Flp pilus assembly protein TadB